MPKPIYQLIRCGDADTSGEPTKYLLWRIEDGSAWSVGNVIRYGPSDWQAVLFGDHGDETCDVKTRREAVEWLLRRNQRR